MHEIYQTKSFPKLVKLAIDNDCTTMLVVGDIFDRPNPDQRIKDRLITALTKYLAKTNLQFIFVAGNHDYTTKSQDYHSLQYLHIIRELVHSVARNPCNFQVAEPGQTVSAEGFDLYVLRHWNDVSVRAKDKPLVLAWHGTVPGLNLARPKDVPSSVKSSAASLLNRTGAAYIALGDIHRCVRISDRCWYPGPPVQKTYVDKDGVLVVDVEPGEAAVTQHRLKLPKKMSISVTFEDGKDTESSVIEFIKTKVPKNQLVKLKFSMPVSVWSSLNKAYIREHLEDYCYELILENDPVPEEHVRKSMAQFSKAKSLIDEVGVLVKDYGSLLDKDKLLRICTKYI